jgi:glycosyltransferase involved in cell wall biosynthesis
VKIAFLCQPTTSAGVWTAESVNTGIGGSEEATIHMAELLAQREHQVSVHMAGAEGPRQLGSVIYDDYGSLGGQTIDVAVMWADPRMAECPAALNFRARRSYLWLHAKLPEGRILQYEHMYRKVIVLSNYHRQCVAQLPDDLILLSSDGIDPRQFDGDDNERDPYLVVYGSDYSRGLATLLSCWPTIKAHVPQCRLNVFYGWEGMERRAPQLANDLHRELDPLLRQPGVSHLGRISHQAVATQYMRAGIWAYPCRFPETCCISAMKAQAGGAVPAVIPTGALRETVRFGFRTQYGYDDIPAASSDRDLAGEWLQGLIHLLRSPAEQTRIRREMIPASKARFAWSTVVDQWEREFTDSADAPHTTPAFP